ncbi:hypothetical protein B5F83_07105 [Muribaculum sp. An289]|nr:hypothetical protein B5F83_07105 [Muribaculum sp. An289]OUO42707.1 hypothetical protein B5F81_06590 [Muribaculum sp. An287]
MNQIPTTPGHFPAENVDSTAIFAVFPGKVNQFAANQVHFPLRLLNTDSQRIHKVGYTSQFHFMTDKATSREKNDRGKNDRGHDERRKTVFYRHIFHPMSILLSLIVLIVSEL